MNYDKEIKSLWAELVKVIDAAAATGEPHADILRDYSGRSNGRDYRELNRLVREETENEKGHRRLAPDGSRFPLTNHAAAMCLLLENIAREAYNKKPSPPPATDFLRFRRSAVEAQCLGWLLQSRLEGQWLKRSLALDYSQIMNEQKTQNNCDGSGPHMLGEVRLMPTGGDGNLILCSNCWNKELQYRRERNRELGEFAQFDLPSWFEGKIYEQ